MRSHSCINGTLQGSEKYSAPIPVIGLYIAAASAVCALLMLYDIVHGFIKRKRWLPCKLFKLNSVTLSLIGVVVKLTVDLTTTMPSALDQLSKLAGTTCLCIYMCYIYPSIPDMKDSTNMFALSILVVTVIVNICIQLSTGVIALFFTEHVVVLCFMLALLVILWRVVFVAKNEKRDSVATGKSEFMTGKLRRMKSFLQRLKDCYLANYKVNPQFRACRNLECGTVGDLSLISLAILIQAAIRSIILKKENLCMGRSSDYQWSMAMIVVTQFVFIIIGSFASGFRRWTMLFYVDLDNTNYFLNLIEEPYSSNPMLNGKYSLVIAVDDVYLFVHMFICCLFVHMLVTFFIWVMSCMRKAFSRVFIMVIYYTSSEEEWTNRVEWLSSDVEFESFIDFLDHFNAPSDEWINRKSESDMEKLIKGSKRKSNDLCNLLSSIIPVHSVIGNYDEVVNFPGYQGPTQEIRLPPARLHPLVVLVRLVEVAIPESPCQDRIVKTFREAFETLHFIEKYMHNTTLGDIKETEIAKALWRAGDFSRLLPVNLRSSDQSPLPVDHAFHVMDCIYEKMKPGMNINEHSVTATVKQITYFLEQRSYSSTEELKNSMQALFVYLLNVMLAQLPDAIFKAVSQSPDDEFEERVRQSLKHLCMFESWDGTDKWKPPQGFENCSGLFDPKEPGPPNVVIQNPALASPNDTPQSDVPANPPVQDEGEEQGDTGIQLPATLNEGNEILSSEEHHVTIADEDGIVEIQSI
ncbi:hypothetical protein ACHQM5_011642 [Ranunculus cassubicifolius]